MSFYAITYNLIEETHACGCGDDHHDHEHEHHEHHHHRDNYKINGEIKELGAWAHFMPTSYLVKTDLNADEILAKLKLVLEANDLLFVTKVDKEDVASLTPELVSWIKA